MLTHWSYIFLALIYRYANDFIMICCLYGDSSDVFDYILQAALLALGQSHSVGEVTLKDMCKIDTHFIQQQNTKKHELYVYFLWCNIFPSMDIKRGNITYGCLLCCKQHVSYKMYLHGNLFLFLAHLYIKLHGIGKLHLIVTCNNQILCQCCGQPSTLFEFDLKIFD